MAIAILQIVVPERTVSFNEAKIIRALAAALPVMSPQSRDRRSPNHPRPTRGPDGGAEFGQPRPPLAPLSRAAASILCLWPRAVPSRRPPLRLQFRRFRRNRRAYDFYRDVDPGDNPTTPYVRLNGAIAGVPEQRGAFYRDVPPGRYQITVDSEGMSPSSSRDVVLAAGEQMVAAIDLIPILIAEPMLEAA